MKTKFKRKLSSYVLIWFIGMLIFSAAVVKIVSALRHLNTDNERQVRINSFLNVVNKKIEDNHNALRILANNNTLKSFVSGDAGVATSEVNAVLEATHDILSASLVYVMNPGGDVVASSFYEGGKDLIGNNYSFRPYFIQAMNGKEYSYPAVGVTTLERGLYLSAPIYSEENVILGVVVVKMGFDDIDAHLCRYALPNALISADGVIFASNRENWILKLFTPQSKDHLAHLQEMKQYAETSLEVLPLERGVKTLTVDGTTYTVFRKDMNIPGWEAVFCYKPGELRPLSRFQELIIILASGAVVFVFTVFLIVVYSVGKYPPEQRKHALLCRILLLVFALILIVLILSLWGFYYFQQREAAKRLSFYSCQDREYI